MGEIFCNIYFFRMVLYNERTNYEDIYEEDNTMRADLFAAFFIWVGWATDYFGSVLKQNGCTLLKHITRYLLLCSLLQKINPREDH